MSRWRALGGVSRGPRQERHSIYVGSLAFRGSCSVSVASAGDVITRPLLGSIDLLAQLKGHLFAYTGVSSWVGSMAGTRMLYSGRLDTAGSCVTTAPPATITYRGRADFRGLAVPALSLTGLLSTLGQCRVSAPSVAPTYAGLMDLRGVLTPALPYLGTLDLRGAELTSPRYLGSLDTLGSCVTAAPSIIIYSGRADFQGLVRPANSLTGLLTTLGQCQVTAPSVAPTYAGPLDLLGRGVTASRYLGRLDAAGQCQVTLATKWPNGYRYRARIVVPATSIQWATGTLPMVVFVNETKAELAHTSHGGFVTSLTGADIRCEDVSGNKIPHGFESYDPVAGATRVWVRPPPPTAGSNRAFYIYIGNPSVVTTEEDWAGTSADFHAWWNCATGTDRCAGAHDLAAQGGPITATVLKGMQACDLNGTSQWFEAAHYATWGGWGAVTLDTWSQANAILPAATGSPPTGDSKAIFCEGPHETSANDSMALFYRSGTTVAPTIPDPILFSLVCAHGDPAFIGWAISTANQQVTTPVHLAGTWSSPNVPKLYKSGAVLTLGSSAPATGTVWQATGGPIMIGHGPSITNFPGTPWAGPIGMCRVRTIEVTPAQLLTEFNNQNDPSAFYGFGGWDQFPDTNLAPIAVPAPVITVAWSASGIPIDVLANDIDPESGTLTLDSVQNPPTGQGTCDLGTGTNLNKVVYTPPAGFSGAVGFFYTCKDSGGKISRGRQLLKVTAADVNLEIPTPLRVIWGNAALNAGIDDAKLKDLLDQTATSQAWPTGVFSTPAGTATHFKLEPGDHVMLAAGNFDTKRDLTTGSPGFATVFNKVGSASAPIVFRAVPAAMAASLGDAGHKQVDHTKDVAGYPENAPGNPNANNNMGLLTDPARTDPIVTVAGRVNIRHVWAIRGQDCIFYGLLFIGGNGRMHLGGLRNTVLRCEFTGWFIGRSACSPSRWSDVEQDCAIRYCTFHEPAEWGVAGGGEPADAANTATQVNWPPARAGKYTKQLKDYDQGKGHLKFAVRWYNDVLEGAYPQCAKNVWIQRCLFRDLISKPDPGEYGTGQTDAIEPGGNVDNGQGTPKYTIDTIGGLKFVAAISEYTNFAPLIERCVIARHHEGAGAAIFDCKMSGIVARKMTFINNNGPTSPGGGSAFDLRGCWFSTFQDIDMSQSNGMLMRINGFGHTLQRIQTDGSVQVGCGDANAVGDFTDQPDPFHYESADSIFLEDITIMDGGDSLEIGKVVGKKNDATPYDQFPVRRITVNRASKAPQLDAGHILTTVPPTVTITNTGANVQLPQNCPKETEVGWRAAWQGVN